MLRPSHLACAVALALASSVALAQPAPAATSDTVGPFDRVVVFGDSLSDDGNLALASGLPAIVRFTTNPGQTAIEEVAQSLGAPLSPSLAGGTDFAVGGAGLVNNSPGTPAGVPLLPAQLATYFTATGGKADPTTLYTVWGGANDIFYGATSGAAAAAAQAKIQALVTAQVNAAVTANPALAGDPTALAALTQQVTAAVAAQVVPAAEAQAGVSSLMNAAQVQASIQQAAATELGMLGQLQKAGARYVMVFNLPNIGLTPDGRAGGAAAAAQLTGLSITFNSTLNTGLAASGLNIIPINTFALLDQIAANPAQYGLTNVTQPACTGSSFGCLPAGTPGATSTYQPGTQNTYLFADGVHPTTAAHAMLAQYAESVIAAPGEMSLLGEAPLLVNETVNRSIVTQATSRLGGAAGDGLRVWANYGHTNQTLDAQADAPRSGNDLNTLSVGADVHPADIMTAGIAFTAGQQKDDFANNLGGFKLRDLLATGYVMFGFDDAYVGAIGSFGHLGYSDIYRNVAIGPALLHETGSTSGSHLAFALTGGWWIDFGQWRTGPFANIGWQHIHVNGFDENGNDATAMTFGNQDRHALISTLGWQAQADFAAGSLMLHPYARVAWNHDSDANPRDVTAGIVTMPGTFALPGFVPDRNWGDAGVGLAADFTPRFSGWIGYDGRFSDSSQSVNSFNLGARLRF
ncbi:MAG TPA: autotransporter domain-containing protein [Rhodanobacteraceae bacterium]|nr:autotransporter domain-containing protein [Rhodanobacteraceae bacterium]